VKKQRNEKIAACKKTGVPRI
jgi:hypothetical protein